MKSESALMSMVENYPYPASFKAADTGKYLLSNTLTAQGLGMENPKDLAGLTVYDINFLNPDWGAKYANEIAELEFRACETKTHVLSRHRLLFRNSYSDDKGEAQLTEMIKSPVLGRKKNILGIITYRRDVTNTLSYSEVYDLYRHFYDKPEAIKRVLAYLNVAQCFVTPPTEAPFRVFLAKAERCHADKEIAKSLDISYRTVEWQTQGLSNCVVDGDLHCVLSLVKRRAA